MTASAALPSRRWPTAGSVGLLALLSLGGWLANWCKLELFFDCDLLFGSIFVMFVLLRHGLAAGLAVSLIVSSCSYLQWNHPWAMVICGAETLLAGWLHRRRNWELLSADLMFWCSAGALLVWLLYHCVMGFTAQSTLVMALKLGINGVLNTLIATVLDLLLRRSRAGDRPLPSLRRLLFVAMSAMAMLPAFGYLYFDLRRLMHQELGNLRLATLSASSAGTELVTLWVEQNLHTVATLASLAATPDMADHGALGAVVGKIRSSNPEFSRLGVIDRDAVTIAFSPGVLEDGSSGVGVSLADRGYIRKLRETRAPMVSELFAGRIGRPGPRLVLVAPVIADRLVRGAALGVLDLGQLRGYLLRIGAAQPVDVTLVDRQRRVVASTRAALRTMEPFTLPTGGRLQPVGGGVDHWIPELARGSSSMQRWSSSCYHKETAVSPLTGWSIVVESSLQPTLARLGGKMAAALATMACLLLLTVVVSRLLAARLAEVFRTLRIATSQLPERIVSGEPLHWPAPLTEEAEGLTANFQMMASTLQQHVFELGALNQDLGTRVEQRTRELSEANLRLQSEADDRQVAQADLAAKQLQLEELNHRLGELVDRSVAEIRRKDQVMITQGRQAAMGEMIGNIAHQWRQPLNALGLLLANIKDAYQFDELDADYLEKAVAEGNRLVQKMSVTIDDFRNFFHPGKEAVAFSARRQIEDAVSLVASSFSKDNIRIRLQTDEEVDLFGFPNEYSQVLLNLLSNAKDAMISSRVPDGSIEVVLSRLGGQGCVTVTDNGGGIPVDHLDRIFEPYFSTKELGTGIGLYMSKMIIERNMHGSVRARNVEGGAQFTVCTPMQPAGSSAP